MTDREAFEKWYEDDAMPLESNWFERFDDGEYVLPDTEDAWRAWQACSAHYEARIKELEDSLNEIGWLVAGKGAPSNCSDIVQHQKYKIEHILIHALTDKGE